MATKDPPTPTTSGCNSSGNIPLSPANPQPAGNSPSSTSTPSRRNLAPLPLTSSITTGATSTIATGSGIPSSGSNRPSSHQKHRRVLSAVEGSAAQSFLISALDSLNADMPQPSMSAIAAAASSSTPPYRHKPHHRDMFPDTSTSTDHHPPPVPAATFSQWNNAALTKSQWDNGDADGLLLPPTDPCFDGSSSVAATAAASTSSHRSILSNPSDDDEEDDEDGLVVTDDHDDDLCDQPSSHPSDQPSSHPSDHPISHPSSHSHHQTSPPCDHFHSDLHNSSTENTSQVKRVRVQQQLLHQRRLQNAQARVRASQTPPPPPLAVMKCEDVSQHFDDMKKEWETSFERLKEQQKGGFDKILSFLQGEASKRSAIESRLHAQLLLQSESMVAMELKLLRLEAKVHQKEQRRFQRLGVITNTIEEDLPLDDILGGQVPGGERRERETRMPERAVVSSGASLVSAVTATSGLEDGMSLREEDEEDDDEDSGCDGSTVEGGGGVVGGAVVRVDTGGGVVGDAPTGQSTSRPPTLDSILLNPTFSSVQSITNESTRAVRPPPDPTDASSLATSVTSATLTSTVVTATTSSVVNPSGTTRILITPNDTSNNAASTPPSAHPPISERPSRTSERDANIDELFGSMVTTPPHHHHRDAQPRSRSQSPLTVPSIGTNTGERSSVVTYDTAGRGGTPSIGTASLNSGVASSGALSTAAVAPTRDFRSRRAVQAAAMAAAMNNQDNNVEEGTGGGNRPLANRVVSFVSPDEIFQASGYSEAGDSVTIPDELDNLSDMVDTFASGATRWREEYEARLDAIQKRWASE